MSKETANINMMRLREAIEASWDAQTSYRAVSEAGNPALGQCYPTARVLQQFFPELEIVEGYVQAGGRREHHFWNALEISGGPYYIDWTWQQFPVGSQVVEFKIRDRETLADSQATIDRCELLKSRVLKYLQNSVS